MPFEPRHSTIQRLSDREEHPRFTVVDLHFFFTSICNSGCQTCDIWKEKRRVEFPAAEVMRLADLPMLRDTAFVLLGGEFTIHSEYIEIVKGLNERNHPYYMFSNGILPERIYRTYAEAGGIKNLSMSVDAYGAKHDEIRGFPGNFERIREIATWVRREHPETFLRFAYTVSPYNTRQDLEEVIAFAKDLGVDVRVGYMTAASIYSTFTHREIPQYYPIDDLYHDKYIALYSAWAKGWSVPCTGIYYHPAIMQDGRLILCQNLGVSLGNVLERPFEEIWNDPATREKIATYESCNKCWMSCQRKYDAERLTWEQIGEIRKTYA